MEGALYQPDILWLIGLELMKKEMRGVLFLSMTCSHAHDCLQQLMTQRRERLTGAQTVLARRWHLNRFLAEKRAPLGVQNPKNRKVINGYSHNMFGMAGVISHLDKYDHIYAGETSIKAVELLAQKQGLTHDTLTSRFSGSIWPSFWLLQSWSGNNKGSVLKLCDMMIGFRVKGKNLKTVQLSRNGESLELHCCERTATQISGWPVTALQITRYNYDPPWFIELNDDAIVDECWIKFAYINDKYMCFMNNRRRLDRT